MGGGESDRLKQISWLENDLIVYAFIQSMILNTERVLVILSRRLFNQTFLLSMSREFMFDRGSTQ